MLLRLLFSTFAVAVAQQCSSSDCELACTEFTTYANYCNFDHQIYDSFATCICTYGGLKDTVSLLDQCTVCNDAGLISKYTLAEFQQQDVICQAYLVSGESAAHSVEADSPASVIEFFSATALPALSSALCGGASSQSSAAAVGGSGSGGSGSGGGGVSTTSTSSGINGLPTSQTKNAAQPTPMGLSGSVGYLAAVAAGLALL